MLKLARDEITNINKQHELEITNMLDKLNLTRDSNLKKLKNDLRSNVSNNPETTTKAQVRKLTAPLFDTEDSKVEEEDNGDENTNKKQVQWDNQIEDFRTKTKEKKEKKALKDIQNKIMSNSMN